MMSKRNIALLALLLLQVVLIGYLYMPRQESGTAKRFFPDLQPEAVVRLTVAAAEGKQVAVKREAGGWVVDTPEQYPADREKIDNLLTRLADLSSDRLVAQTEEGHNRFRVGASPNQHLTLTMQDGKEQSLSLGTSPSYNATHVRAGGDTGVYLVAEFAPWQLPADEKFWWQREYVAMQPEGLVEVSLHNSHGELQLYRAEDQGWQVAGLIEGQQADGAAVQDFVAAVSRIALTDYLGREERPEFRLDKPLATLTLKSKELTVTLKVGAKDEQAGMAGAYVMKSSASPFYVQAGSAVIAPLLDRQQGDLIAKP